MRLLFWIIVASIANLTQSVQAEKIQLRGIKGDDDRVMIEQYDYPWSAVGRLNKEVGGFCTGTLIAPKLVLTAGHCVWHERRKKWLLPHTIHFLAGYRRGSFISHSVGEKIILSPNYDPTKEKKISMAAVDWALIILKEDMSKEVGTIGVADLTLSDLKALESRKTTYVQAGYSQDKAHILSINETCTMDQFDAQMKVGIHSCDAVSGDSGSPLFYDDKGKKKIAYIHVATTKKGASKGIAVSTVAIAQHLKQLGYWDQARNSKVPRK